MQEGEIKLVHIYFVRSLYIIDYTTLFYMKNNYTFSKLLSLYLLFIINIKLDSQLLSLQLSKD